jgi:hypothetical protein
MMHGWEKSDPIVVAMKPAKSPAPAGASWWSQGSGPRGRRNRTARTGHCAGHACIFNLLRLRHAYTLAVIHPRWEPGALVGHAGFCAGGAR